MDIANLIRPELLALAPVLYVIGVLIKKNPKINAYVIPFILTGISALLCVLYCVFIIGESFSAATVFSGIIQGILIAAATVGGHQYIKQLGEKASQPQELTSEEIEQTIIQDDDVSNNDCEDNQQ